jgi:putative ribosome biogenesis GTPase RsgA
MPSCFSTEMEKEKLKEMMIGKEYVSGHSGVGKSTLVNAGASLHLKNKSDLASKQGQHTTTLLKCMICL